MIAQTKPLGNDWFMEIRYGQHRTTYRIGYGKNGNLAPITFYSEQALREWAAKYGIKFTDD